MGNEIIINTIIYDDDYNPINLNSRHLNLQELKLLELEIDNYNIKIEVTKKWE